MPPYVDELSSFPQSIPHPTQLHSPPQIPPNSPMVFPEGIDNYDSLFADGISGSPPSPLPDFQGDADAWWTDDSAAPMEHLGDGRRPCGTDADVVGVNDDVAAPQAAHSVHACGGGHGHAAGPCCAAGTAEIQHLGLGEIDAHWRLHSLEQNDVELQQEQRLFTEGEPSTEPYEKLEEEGQRWFDLWKSTALQDLFPEVQPGTHSRTSFQKFNLEELSSRLFSWERMNSREFQNDKLSDSKGVSIVPFTGLDSKGKKAQRGAWKETRLKGLRVVADPSMTQPPGQQQRYVGLKKTLEMDDDGQGNKRRAHEYTPLLPSDDHTDKLVPAEISLRIEFNEEPPSSLKRSRTGDLKSEVWDHMTELHVKVTPKGSRKKPYYKVMHAICHHCDKFFNADSKDGTKNQHTH